MDGLLFALTLLSALGCGLMAGVFFAFSAFEMRALASLQPTQGIPAMQSINRGGDQSVVLRRVHWNGGGLHFDGCSCCVPVVPACCRLPYDRQPVLSDRHVLGDDRVQCADERRAGDRRSGGRRRDTAWAGYLSRWTAWNHVRTVAALLGAAAFRHRFPSPLSVHRIRSTDRLTANRLPPTDKVLV